MVFRLSNSNTAPASPTTLQRGFPAVGAGGQTISDSYNGLPPITYGGAPVRPTQGKRSFFRPASGSNAQRGFPAPQNAAQARPPGSMPNCPSVSGLPEPVYTDYYSRGAAAYVQNYGKVLENPIGAGVVAMYRPQPSYGPAAQYIANELWWSSQVVPTSINIQGLTSPDVLAAILNTVTIQAVIPGQ